MLQMVPGPHTYQVVLALNVLLVLHVTCCFVLCLLGLATGGMWGLIEGARRPLTRATPSAAFSLASLNAMSAREARAAAAAAGGEPVAPGAAPAAAAASAGPSRPNPGPAPGTATAAAAAPRQPTMRLRINTILNSMTSRGSFVGNNAGVLGMLDDILVDLCDPDKRCPGLAALIYNGINCTIDKYRGVHDIYGSMMAGAGTGFIWKSTGEWLR